MTAEQVLAVARKYIGYHEKASNAQLEDFKANSGSNNWNRFAAELDAVKNFYNGEKNGYAWCDIFADACVYEASGNDFNKTRYVLCQPLNSAGAGCYYSAQYYKNEGRWSKSPQIGAQIFFTYSAGEVSHTGLVESYTATTVTTIEGNTSDMVARRTYAIGDPHIYGYGLPRYDGASSQPPTKEEQTVSITLRVLERNDNVDELVRSAQALLIARGCSCGWYGADGEFGVSTERGVKSFQTRNDLPVTGKVDAKTWPKLLGLN